MESAIKRILNILFLCVLLASCRQKPAEETALIIPAYETREFLDFYEKFASDSVYQLEHIVFPLEGMPALRDSTDVIPADFKWEKENWILHKAYDDMNGTFTREFIDFKGIVIEKIGDNSGRYTMERRFSKMSDGWQLIYYRAMGLSQFN